jgi:hypothetical protein
MITEEDKRRIEEEERHRAAVRAQIAAEDGARQASKDSQSFMRVQSAQKTTNIREGFDNFRFWVRLVFGGIFLLIFLTFCTVMLSHKN